MYGARLTRRQFLGLTTACGVLPILGCSGTDPPPGTAPPSETCQVGMPLAPEARGYRSPTELTEEQLALLTIPASLSISRDGAWAASASRYKGGTQRGVTVWDLASGEIARHAQGGTGRSMQWLSDNTTLAFSDVDAVVLVDVGSGSTRHFMSGIEPTLTIPTGWEANNALDVTPDRSTLCIAGNDRTLRFFAMDTCAPGEVVRLGSRYPRYTGIRYAGDDLVVPRPGAAPELRHPESGEPRGQLGGKDLGAALLLSGDGSTLAVSSAREKGVAHLFDVGE